MTRRPLALAAVLLLAACGSGSGGSSFTETGRVAAAGTGADQTATLEMNDALTFVPNVVTAAVGTLTLEAVNVGKVPHNLVFDDRALPRTDSIGGGKAGTLKVTFSAPGTFTFTCTFHPGMDGKVVVAAAGQG
jgi:plastocyanin